MRLSPVKRIVFFASIAIATFFLARVFLFLLYRPTFFSHLETPSIVLAFLVGLKFDLSVICAFFGFPFLLIALPVVAEKSRAWIGFWSWFCWAILVGLMLFLIGDVLYFDFVKRHASDELLLLGNETGFLLQSLLSTYVVAFAGFILASASLWFIWRWIVRQPIEEGRWPFANLFLILALTTVGIRGNFSGKPINVIDAFISDDGALAQLILNGIFTSSRAILSTNTVDRPKIDPKQIRVSLATIGIDPEKTYPLFHALAPDRRSPAVMRKLEKPNIVIVLLESWGAFYVDSFGGKAFKATPKFDAIAQKSLRFSNFYANGSRSIEAIQHILTGVPSLKGLPTLGTGLEVMNVSKMGVFAKRQGYKTLFVQASDRRSFRLDSAAMALGFDEYYGREDAPAKLDYPDPEASIFGWDYESYMLLDERLNQTREPFLAFLFTGTTHTPFALPPKNLMIAKHGEESEGGFLNTLSYADWSLGEFLSVAEKSPWFKNTIFIFTADHTWSAHRDHDFVEQHKIPFIVYAPNLIRPGVDAKVASHLDLLPTVVDLIGSKDEFGALGESVFSKGPGLAFITGRFSSPAIITHDGYLEHSMKRRLRKSAFDEKCRKPCFEAMENLLLSLDELSYQAIQSNRWNRQ